MSHPVPVSFNQRRHFSRWVRFGVPSIGLFLLWLMYHEVPLLFSSMMISWGLYYILNPAVDFLEARSIRRTVASGIVLLGVIAVIYMAWLRFLDFSAEFRSKLDLDAFQKNLVRTTHQLIVWSEGEAPVLKRFFEPETHAPSPPQNSHGKHETDPSKKVAATLVGVAVALTLEERINAFYEEKVAEWVGPLTVKVINLLPNLILIPYFTFFFLKDGREFRKTLIGWIPNKYFEPAMKFFYELDRRLRSYLLTMLLDCMLVGTLVGVGSAIVGAPNPVVFGLIAFLLNTIPLLGPLLYGLICLLITIGSGKPPEVILGFVGVFLLSRLCDDLIFVPTIYGKSNHIHPIVVVCAVLLGETVAGVWGMFLAIPIVSVLFLGMGIIREISMGEEVEELPPSAFAPFA